MPGIQDYLSMIAVGALWGCTNPLLRRGAVQNKTISNGSDPGNSPPAAVTGDGWLSALETLKKFRRVQVWIPYALNQLGSVLFYFTLGKSEVSLAVPICNGLSLVFSIIASFLIGESIEDPVRTIVGSFLVVIGVALCVVSSTSS